MKKKIEIFEKGAVLIQSNHIQKIGEPSRLISQYPDQKIMRLDRTVLMPGLVNVHTHLELPALLSTIRSRDYADWVLGLIKAKQNLKINDYRKAARKNIDALIRTGTTTVADICTHGTSPDALAASGIRSMIFREIISMHPRKSSKLLLFQHKEPASHLLRTSLSPHSPHTVSENVLLRIRDFADANNLRLAMHVAESREEIKLLQRKRTSLKKLYVAAGWDIDWAPTGTTSIEYLKKIGLLGQRFLAVHTVQATDRDIEIIRKSKASIAHCARSNSELGVGKMPLKKFLDAGISVGLGTDSLASSPSLNMWDEMRYACRIHKKSGVTAKDIFTIATIGGAKALGMEKEIGTLEPGKKADMIAVPLPKKTTGDIYSDLLRETESSIMTMVDGRILFDRSSEFGVRNSE